MSVKAPVSSPPQSVTSKSQAKNSKKPTHPLPFQRCNALSGDPEDPGPDSVMGMGFYQDFSQIPIHAQSPLTIQPKLTVNPPGDKYEQEADRVAEQVMRVMEPHLVSSNVDLKLANSIVSRSGAIQRFCTTCSEKYNTVEKERRPVNNAHLCQKCKTQGQGLRQTKQITSSIQTKIQTKLTGNLIPQVTPEISSNVRALQGGGHPLSEAERSFYEPRFRTDFSGVRVHIDARASNVAHSLNARAFTVGQNIVFGTGEYAPQTFSGKRLLAHELTHVVQQRKAATYSMLQCAPEQEKPETPSQIGMMVSISGLIFQVPEGITFKPGRKTPQLLTIVLKRLLGPQYKPGLEREVEGELSKKKYKRGGGFKEDAKPAKGGEPIGQVTLALQPTLILLDFLKAKKLQVQLTPQQEELLNLGIANLILWADFLRTIKESGNPLPSWYNQDIFDREMAQHGKLLREYADLLRRVRGGEETARVSGLETISKVIDALYGPAMVLESIRLDIRLAANEETSGIYSALWQLPRPRKGETPKLTSPPTKLRSSATAVLFLGYMRTQPQFAVNAEVNAADRIELVKRYARFTQQLLFTGAVKEGAEEIRDQPATANYPAFPCTLTALPPLSPPLFDAAAETDQRFRMEVQFPSVYEALGRYAFNWERVRIPDNKIGEPVDVSKLEGERPTSGEVATVRFGRATAYAKADIKRVLDEMSTDIGPVGVGALELVGANAILRYLGTGIRLGLEILTMPRDQKSIGFPSPGLYMVRAAMSQVREGKEEVVRAPSVAYYPVLARNPDEMAAGRVKATLSARENTEKRIKELEAMLRKTDLAPDEKKQFEQELVALRMAVAPFGTRLESRREEIAKQIAAIKSGAEQGDLEAAIKEHENLDKIVALRAKRKISDAELLTARFVSDLGQTIPLMLEVVDRPASKKGRVQVYISDVTTPKSGDGTGSGTTRDDAIVHGIRRLLEGTHGYGRGRVAVSLGSAVRTIRIEASLGSLLSESIENVAMALSVAAIAAAPFTGGASLSIMIPVGLVGAIPSAYRVVQRIEAGTFELDLENALEIVNIAGSLIGLGRLGATSLRMMRIGKAMLIVGYGVDAAGGILMGAQLITQIESLAKLPEGERAAALLLLVGQQMLNAGMMVGGALAQRAHQMQAETKGGKLKGLAEEKPSTPGEPPGKKPMGPSADIFEKARVDAEMGRLGKMDPESEARLRFDEPLRTALADQPLAGAALKKCASPCYPPDIKPEQVARLDRLLSRLAETGVYNEAALKKYLYDRRDDISKAIANIEGVHIVKDFNAWLNFYNHGGEVKKLPPKGDPKELAARFERAHDIGVEKGSAQAKADDLVDVGFQNPFERRGKFGQGFDDVMKKGQTLDTGDIYIVEFKGGEARLAHGQMSLEWVIGNIRRLYNEGGASGQGWARILAKALREGRLKGVAYSTPMDGNVPMPTETISTWTYAPTNIKIGL